MRQNGNLEDHGREGYREHLRSRSEEHFRSSTSFYVSVKRITGC
uniref:Uncharacterized protein n=1 Tax=Aegilops tauschii subsp. strangulata TaxID=200361 RepID=A0A453R9J1_AEGTS